jgi:putative ABC transport system permease protein
VFALLAFLKQSARASLTALLTNKVRSFLTMLGIIIGVAAVVIIMALGAGAQGLILNQVKSMGTNKIGIMPGKADANGPPASAMGIVITSLKYEDALAIKESGQVPNVIGVVAYNNSTENVVYGGNSYITTIRGSAGDYFEVEGGELAGGRFFTEAESAAKVAVLGDTVKEELFGEEDPIGKKIKIKKSVFEVIGVMAKRGTVAFQNYDDMVIVPNQTLRKSLLGLNYVNFIRVAVDREENLPETAEAIKYVLRSQHDISDQSGDSDDFDVRNSADAIEMIKVFTNALKFFLAAMAAVSLVVGGIGIMNIMLVRVNERTREIGLRKAVGASNSRITLQFLIEAVIITLLGGIIGTLFGFSVSYLVALVIRYLGYDWDFVVSPFSVALALVVSASIGLIFGIAPARKAAKMDPVQALRYE